MASRWGFLKAWEFTRHDDSCECDECETLADALDAAYRAGERRGRERALKLSDGELAAVASFAADAWARRNFWTDVVRAIQGYLEQRALPDCDPPEVHGQPCMTCGAPTRVGDCINECTANPNHATLHAPEDPTEVK